MADQSRQILLLGVMLVGGLGYVGYEYVYKPQSASIQVLEERLARLETQNQTARQLSASAGRSQVERRLSRYNEQLVQVEALIPSSEELPDLLDAISIEAQRYGVELALIQPVGAEAEQFYTRRTYDLGVRGSYHQIGSFLASIASLRRIITPINLNMTVRTEAGAAGQGATPELEARFAIETYVLPSAEFPSPLPDSTAVEAGAQDE